MTEVELIYNAASLNDGTLNGHYAGLVACVEYGRKLEREMRVDETVDKIMDTLNGN